MSDIYKGIYLNQIRPGRFQPRKGFEAEKLLALARSIEERGLINSVKVFMNPDGHYELLAGERRWRATCALALAGQLEESTEEGLPEAIGFTGSDEWPDIVARGDWSVLSTCTIRANELPAYIGEDVQQEIAIIDNLQREDLTPIEEGQALAELKEVFNLSLRALADKVGKSKSYVDDRITMARELTPEVAARVVDEDAPLDLSIAREMARKIPADLQGPLVDELQKLSNVETKQIIKFINQAAKFIDPNRYSLSDDLDTPTSATWFNRARLLRHLLENAPAERLAKALVKLAGLADGYYSNHLTGKVATLLDGSYAYRQMVVKLADGGPEQDGDDIWETVAAPEGWTCESCAMKDLRGGIEELGEIEHEVVGWNPPCRKLQRHQDVEAITTCVGYVGPDDPQVIETSRLMYWLDDAETGQVEVKTPLRGADDGSYVETWDGYFALYVMAVQERERMATEQEEAEQSAHLAPMLAYWQAQRDGVFDLAHFQAHNCASCVHYLNGPSFEADVPCALAAKPLKQNGVPRPPDYKVWVSETGVAVPRCEKFQYRELPPIQRSILSGFTIGDRELILGWYKVISGDNSNLYRLGQLGIYGPLNWLNGDVRRVWDRLDGDGADDIMMIILSTGINERLLNRHFGDEFKMFDPTTGEKTAWRVLAWKNFVERQQPYNWGEWPWPFEAASEEETNEPTTTTGQPRTAPLRARTPRPAGHGSP